MLADNKNEKIEELPCDAGMVPSGTEIPKEETIPQVSSEIIERDDTSEGLLTGDGTAGPSKETGMELTQTSLSSSEKNEDLHKDTGKCKPCKYVLAGCDTICNLERAMGNNSLHITIPQNGEIELLPAEIENFEHHEGVCIENDVFSPSEDIGTNSPLEKNGSTYLEKEVSTSRLMDYAKPPPKGNEAIKPLPDELKKVEELSNKDNLPGCTTMIETSEGASTQNGTTLTLEYVGTETSDLITKIKPIEGILMEVGINIPLEDAVSPSGVISTKCGTHPPDDPGIEKFNGILPEEGSTTFCLQVVGTEPSNICICESKDGSSASVSTEILVEHVENLSSESICTNTDVALLPHDVGEKKPNNEETSILSSGSTEIPVLHIRNDLSEGICEGTGTDLPLEVVSTKHVEIEEDTQPKQASTSQKVDDAALLDENSEGLTFPSKPVEYILPEPLISNFGTDPDMWAPPELAENGTQLQSVANEEEKEDENKYGMNLLQPKIEDEVNEKAMVEIMNTEFKRLLKRFMVAEGFSVPAEAGDEGAPDSWLRVVRILSWQAALLIKPDLVAGKEMDPSLYVKVKCIASGTRIQRLAFTLYIFISHCN